MIDDNQGRREARRRKIAEAEYPVGFGKTDPKTRYKAGLSGNPKGRPKGAKGLSVLIREAAEAPVELTVNGRKTRITRLGASFHQLAIAAAKGDRKATETLAKLYTLHGPPPEPEDNSFDATADAEAIREHVAFVTKFGRTSGT